MFQWARKKCRKYACTILAIFWLVSQTSRVAALEQSVSQQTRGECSPAIIAQGNVSVKCGVSKKLLNRLKAEAAEKNARQDAKIESEATKLETLIKDYQALKESLASQENNLARQAQAKLDDGDFEGAEALFAIVRAAFRGRRKAEKSARGRCFCSASIKVLQLNYAEALSYYRASGRTRP